jgi:hypothetical protein
MEKVMIEGMESFKKNEVIDPVELLTKRNPIGRKWMFKKKLDANGNVEKQKARLEFKDYSRVEGIDFGETFSPSSTLT